MMANDKDVNFVDESVTQEQNPPTVMVSGVPVPTEDLIEAWHSMTFPEAKTDIRKHYMEQLDHLLSTEMDDIVNHAARSTMTPEEIRNAGK